ncbi:uncharacterized protein LOC104417510 [Eucalyptus grandis]|uniref:uncharacterized protein LOC104417510 n=1 Tax=Eucalyptus grandis TaxID=71139 RepID=UPI0005269093|nr:uncharacterized protein LOC104417510 [Eucalyptus grandis]
MKINIDGAYQPASIEGTMACICRDHHGKLTDGLSRHFPACSALQAEIQALTLTVHHLLQHDINHAQLLIELDCLTLVETMHDCILTPWEDCALFAEAPALLSCFPNLHLQHCKREVNVVADWAAKAHGSAALTHNWAISPPFYLLDHVYTDAIALGYTFPFT